MTNYLYSAFAFVSYYKPYMRRKEKVRVSIPINVNNRFYYVVRFLILQWDNVKLDSDLRQLDKPTGFIVLDQNKQVVTDSNLLKKILYIYNVWHHFYINPLFKNIKINYYALNNVLYFNKLILHDIERREIDEYKQVLRKYNADYVKILIELDKQVINQSDFLVAKIKAQKELIKLHIDIYQRPSDILYERVEQLYNEIKLNAAKENEIWNVRKNYWIKLKQYHDNKTNKIKILVKVTGKDIFVTTIETMISFTFPLGLLLDKLYELCKYPLKYLLLSYNNQIIYHKFGVDAITKYMEFNKKLKELSGAMNALKNQPTISLIRNE